MRRRSSGRLLFQHGGGRHCRVSRWQAAGHGSHLAAASDGETPNTFSTSFRPSRHHTDCSTRCRAPPCHQNGRVTPATDRTGLMTVFQHLNPRAGRIRGQWPSAWLTVAVTFFSWCCSPSVQYRRFYVTGTDSSITTSPRKDSDGAAFRGPVPLNLPAGHRLSDALFPHRAAQIKALQLSGDGRLQ